MTRTCIVTLADETGAYEDGLRQMQTEAGLPPYAPADHAAAQPASLLQPGGVRLDELRMAIIVIEEEMAPRVFALAGPHRAVQHVTPSRPMSTPHLALATPTAGMVWADSRTESWGIQAIDAAASSHTGAGIRLASLDTGFGDPGGAGHPDFTSSRIKWGSNFSNDPDMSDRNGHGTYMVGIAGGGTDSSAFRYGVATGSEIHVIKVAGAFGLGTADAVVRGINEAVHARCTIILVGLGFVNPSPSADFTAAAARAARKGALVIAPCGNTRHVLPGTVIQPANSPDVMAVGAIDASEGLYAKSCSSGTAAGSDVDAAAPGVSVYSSVPRPIDPAGPTHKWCTGTSGAAAFAAGTAALWAEATGVVGAALWKEMTLPARVRPLPLPVHDVGAGLIRRP